MKSFRDARNDNKKKAVAKEPVLVIMAAGLGSRYGSLKQIDPVDDKGHIIIDFSVFDAWRAGFKNVICVIRRENEQVFNKAIGDRINKFMNVRCVYQDMEDIPSPFSIPIGRVKPWGTGQAVLCAAGLIDGPFAVINADDYYGRESFKLIYNFLIDSWTGVPMSDNMSSKADNTALDSSLEKTASVMGKYSKPQYVMAGYLLKNTLSENGYVSRGICETDTEGYLTGIIERTRIIGTESGPAFSEDNGLTWSHISPESIVSMNMWGFTKSFMDELKKRFPEFLRENLQENPMDCEYFLPSVVNCLIAERKAYVKVLITEDVWHGVTYAEDKQSVVNAISRLKEEGVYPDSF